MYFAVLADKLWNHLKASSHCTTIDWFVLYTSRPICSVWSVFNLSICQLYCIDNCFLHCYYGC